MLRPVLQARDGAEKSPTYQKSVYTIQWMRDRSRHFKGSNFDEEVLVQIKLGGAATHTTSMALTHIVFDLVARPEYMKRLRDEIRQVLDDDDGTFTESRLAKLELLDSFMKESQRLNPVACCPSLFLPISSPPVGHPKGS